MKKAAISNSRLKYSSILFLLIFFLISSCTSNSEITFPINVGNNPESITKGFNNNYYLTLMNGKENGDGEVVEISKNGVKVFATGFNQPKGIVFLDNHLYFSDVKRIWKVNKKGEAVVFIDKNQFPKEVLSLNDVSLDADKKGIYVADMGASHLIRDKNRNMWPINSKEANEIPNLGRIYHIDLKGKATIAQDTSSLMKNANGVGIDNNNNIMVGSFFLGNFLVKKDSVLTPLKGQFRGADAVEQDSKGNYYISSWEQGKVWKINGKTEESIILIEGLESAADFYLEEENKRLLLPDMKAGKIYEVSIN